MLRRVTVRYIKIHDVVLFTSQIKTLFTMNSYDLYVYDKFIPCDAEDIPQQCCTFCCLFFFENSFASSHSLGRFLQLSSQRAKWRRRQVSLVLEILKSRENWLCQICPKCWLVRKHAFSRCTCCQLPAAVMSIGGLKLGTAVCIA